MSYPIPTAPGHYAIINAAPWTWDSLSPTLITQPTPPHSLKLFKDHLFQEALLGSVILPTPTHPKPSWGSFHLCPSGILAYPHQHTITGYCLLLVLPSIGHDFLIPAPSPIPGNQGTLYCWESDKEWSQQALASLSQPFRSLWNLIINQSIHYPSQLQIT